ncbi:hypothetical protein GCM10009799_20910 [Nocardiopsis rhodophaea]|uniref:Uncharacterized protein n=1 Tax=Nocardiopsis rhodophaea TaxID=280238 RepID=A0ABN2T025_9ACTN
MSVSNVTTTSCGRHGSLAFVGTGTDLAPSEPPEPLDPPDPVDPPDPEPDAAEPSSPSAPPPSAPFPAPGFGLAERSGAGFGETLGDEGA